MRNAILATLIALLLVLSACGNDAAAPSLLSQTRDGLTATLSLDPAAPATMHPVALVLTLLDAQGQAVDGVEARYDLTMPGMTMPKVMPNAVPEGQGRYRVETVFTMSGDWRIKATVTRPEGVTVFDYDITVP